MASPEEVRKNEDNCAICWEPMKEARKLPCAHLFHKYVFFLNNNKLICLKVLRNMFYRDFNVNSFCSIHQKCISGDIFVSVCSAEL